MAYPVPGKPHKNATAFRKNFENIYSFTFVRHPFERFVSAYRMFPGIVKKGTKILSGQILHLESDTGFNVFYLHMQKTNLIQATHFPPLWIISYKMARFQKTYIFGPLGTGAACATLTWVLLGKRRQWNRYIFSILNKSPLFTCLNLKKPKVVKLLKR